MAFFLKKKNVKDNVDLDHVILKEQTQQRRFGLKKNKKKENSCHSPSIAVQLITGGWENDQKKKNNRKKKKKTMDEDKGVPVGGVAPGREASTLCA